MAVLAFTNTGSTYSADACVPNSSRRWAILGFTATPGGSGSCFWFNSPSINTCPLLPIVCASGGLSFLAPVVFNSEAGFFAGCISGGCAVIWLKAACAA